MESKLIPYEVIEKAIDGYLGLLLAIPQQYKPFIDYLSNTILFEGDI